MWVQLHRPLLPPHPLWVHPFFLGSRPMLIHIQLVKPGNNLLLHAQIWGESLPQLPHPIQSCIQATNWTGSPLQSGMTPTRPKLPDTQQVTHTYQHSYVLSSTRHHPTYMVMDPTLCLWEQRCIILTHLDFMHCYSRQWRYIQGALNEPDWLCT